MKRTRRSGDERRDQIARAALAIVDEQGSGALSIASVAHRVGVAPSALYRHFPDKDAMLEQMIARLAAGLRANLDLAVEEADADALEALGAFLNRHVAFVLENRGFPMLIFSDLVLQHAGRRAFMAGMLERFRSVVADLLRQGQRQGRVRTGLDAGSAAFTFMGLFMPAALAWHLSGGRTDLTGTVRRAWAVFVAGVQAPPPPASRARPARRPHRQEKRS